MTLQIGLPQLLTIRGLADAVGNGALLEIGEEARARIGRTRAILDRYTKERLPVYGVNTQFGDDAHLVLIDGDYDSYIRSVVYRQNNVMRALGCGSGEEASNAVERATLLLRIHTLAQGASGVSENLIDRLLAVYNGGIAPVIRRYGSVGASGDLIPLSAIARIVMGEGSAWLGQRLAPAAEALASVNLKPEPLTMKEGLSIVNGTSFMSALAALTLHRLCKLLPLSIAACASCVEAMLGMDSPYMPFVHEGKRHTGQIRVAAFIHDCFEGSQMIRTLAELRVQWREMLLSSGRADQENVQDYYSLRGIAHGFGPFADDLERSVQWVENEMNSLNDNPIIDAETDYIFSSANFLGDYVAVACDHLRADVAKAGTWMHAIFGNLVTARKNRGLPSCLVQDPDVGTGFKIVQLLVGSLAMQNRSLCLPISAVMLPTEGDNQDMVSLGTHSAFNLIDVTNNFQTIIATTMLAAAQALELRGIEKAGAVSRKLWEFVREHSAFLEADRPLHEEIEAISQSLATCNVAEPWFI